MTPKVFEEWLKNQEKKFKASGFNYGISQAFGEALSKFRTVKWESGIVGELENMMEGNEYLIRQDVLKKILSKYKTGGKI